jgi:hypothetical protein
MSSLSKIKDYDFTSQVEVMLKYLFDSNDTQKIIRDDSSIITIGRRIYRILVGVKICNDPVLNEEVSKSLIKNLKTRGGCDFNDTQSEYIHHLVDSNIKIYNH